jgi:hypothetical protein
MKMSLEKWLEMALLRKEPTSRNEIKGLITIVDRDLKDASVAAISEDRRFEAGFNASRTLATIALRAAGLRLTNQPGHHYRTLESLEYTIQADSKLINRLGALSKKRNATSYDSAGNISAQELELVQKTANELKQKVLRLVENQSSRAFTRLIVAKPPD